MTTETTEQREPTAKERKDFIKKSKIYCKLATKSFKGGTNFHDIRVDDILTTNEKVHFLNGATNNLSTLLLPIEGYNEMIKRMEMKIPNLRYQKEYTMRLDLGARYKDFKVAIETNKEDEKKETVGDDMGKEDFDEEMAKRAAISPEEYLKVLEEYKNRPDAKQSKEG